MPIRTTTVADWFSEHLDSISEDCRLTPCTVEHQECVENGGTYSCLCATGYYFVVSGTEDRCRESLTYEAELTIVDIGGVPQIFTAEMSDPGSEVFERSASVVRVALNEHFEASSLSRRYKGVKITAFRDGSVIVRFDVYLSQGPASVSAVTGAFYGNLQGDTFGSSQVTVEPSSFRVFDVVEDNLTSPWYDEPLYLTLVCAGCAVTLTAIIVTLICCYAKRSGQQKKRNEVDIVHPELPLTERQLNSKNKLVFVDPPMD
ncbi:63 kDa sperm flagellar membrane protein-like [Branchiostoma lanceolatum]|uniref:63 kDa sperm flagellar membrane protein-like n=1 Tax=Branchiostoma lanceolatum TaxID=7740 RepID=UPI003453FA81